MTTPWLIRDWLAELVAALEGRPDAGMCASQVRLFGEPRLDSAGMLVARDGSSKQRGHGRLPEDFPVLEEVLMPSGSAALYRRSHAGRHRRLRRRFFSLLRGYRSRPARPLGRLEVPVRPRAVVEHHYSHSAGRASPVKAYYVERNRLFVLVKNFPGPMLLAAPFVALARYLWHAWYIFRGREAPRASAPKATPGPRCSGTWFARTLALLRNLGRLWRQRRQIRARARITPAIFRHLLRSHAISARRMAAL